MKQQLYFLLLVLFLLASCADKSLDPSKPVYVMIETTMGDVTVALYDDTPLHRDNFIKLCQSGEYKDVLFHRVIKEFVVQGGDPESKKHEPGALYGDGDGGYTVPAEILPHHFNKRGVLIDAKESDQFNTERASAGTQFCFVQGKVYNDAELDQIETRIQDIRWKWLYYKFKKEVKEKNPAFSPNDVEAEATTLLEDTLVMLGKAVIPEEHREVYRTLGGVPHLDGSVTIFGEVVEGFDIVEKISLMKTDTNDRPLTDVMIKGTRVFQK